MNGPGGLMTRTWLVAIHPGRPYTVARLNRSNQEDIHGTLE